jgi:predicted alpha/beta hydrolase family esterase
MSSKEISRALVVHGSYGSPDAYWLPWLRTHLEKAGISTVAPQFPTPEGQSLDSWRRVFDDEIGTVGEGWMLFAHSLGVPFLFDVLERNKVPVEGIFVVSGFAGLLDLELFDSVNRTFVDREFDWSLIGACAKRAFVYQGDDDPYVPQKWGTYLAEHLHANLRVIPGGGHLNSVSAQENLQVLLTDVESLISARS